MGLPPAHQEAEAGGEEAGAEAGVEPGEECLRDAGDVFEDYPQGDHEGYDEVAFGAEGFVDGFFGAGQSVYAGGVFSDDSGEHRIEAGEY